MYCLFLSALFPLVAAIDHLLPYTHSRSFDSGRYGPYPNRSYVSEPTLISPRFNVQQFDALCHDGLYVFTSLRGDRVNLKGQSPMIHDTNGTLVWMDAFYGETFNHGVQRYKGEEYLTFWQGDDSVGGHGDGTYIMLDSSYQVAYNFTAGDGRLGDLHEFRITTSGTALITQYRYEKGNWGGPGLKPQGYVWDSVFQEVDIESNTVLFEWHAYDHININASDFPSGSMGRDRFSGYDFFHINSIDKDEAGNYLISSRYYQCLMYIDGKNGKLLWQLGGKNNSFTDLSNGGATIFSWQHDARWTADHSGITLFDNGARYHQKPKLSASRGVHITLDLQAMTAQVENVYINPRSIPSASQGSTQILPSGNVLLGYGYNAAWTEFSKGGEVLCDVHIGSKNWFDKGAVQTYKVLKHAWVGKPLAKPKAVFVDGWLYMSWNGATEVKGWDVQGGNSSVVDESWQVGGMRVKKWSFETEIEVSCHVWRFVRVRAVDGEGVVLGESDVVPINCEYESRLAGTGGLIFGKSAFSVSPSLLSILLYWVVGGIIIYGFLRSRLSKKSHCSCKEDMGSLRPREPKRGCSTVGTA